MIYMHTAHKNRGAMLSASRYIGGRVLDYDTALALSNSASIDVAEAEKNIHASQNWPGQSTKEKAIEMVKQIAAALAAARELRAFSPVGIPFLGPWTLCR